MNTVELFCGTKSFSKVATVRGYRTLTLDNDPQFGADVTADIMTWGGVDGHVDVLWASPPCQGFSVAAIGRNWGGGFRAYEPKSETARLAVRLVERTRAVVAMIKPKWFFIENPRGVLRKLPVVADLRRVTVTYCQYGDTRMKPTDIWTNVPPEIWTPKPLCKNGSPCHEAAPRGSRTGTQGLKNATLRGAIPSALFNEIFDALYGRT